VRDQDMMDWRVGVVTQTKPLRVTLLGWNEDFQWDEVRRTAPLVSSKTGDAKLEKQCPVCGFRFHEEASFCCGCGRKRLNEGDFLNSPPHWPSSSAHPATSPCVKPPLLPSRPAQQPNADRCTVRRASSSPRVQQDRVRGGRPAPRSGSASARLSFGAHSRPECCNCGGRPLHFTKDCPKRRPSAAGDAVNERTLVPTSSTWLQFQD